MDYQIKNDQPIQSKKEDVLGRDTFAKDLAKVIVNYIKFQENKNRDGLVIGLEGEWGSGKTSLINLVKNYLPDSVDVRNFNSWMTTDKNSLAQEFFNIIIDFYKSDADMGEIVYDYLKSFLVKSLNIVDPIISLPFIGNIKLKKMVNELLKRKSLTQQKHEIDIRLHEKQGKWLILFVDDIDRLSYQEIGVLFKLIKNIADFPGVIYVLAYDKEVVINALEKVQENKGKDYLQKVVQINYDIPVPRTWQLDEYFFSLLKVLEPVKNGMIFKNTHFQEVYYPCLQYFFRQIRDCNRLANAFILKYSLCGTECDFADLLAVTALEIFEPRIYHMIYQYKLYLVACNPYGLAITDSEKKEIPIIYNMLLENCSQDKKRYLSDLLRHLFPEFYSIATDNHQITILSQEFGVSNEDDFDRYFALSIDVDEIAIEEIKFFLRYADTTQKIYSRLFVWNAEEKIVYFLQQSIHILQNEDVAYLLNVDRIMSYLEAFSQMKYHRQSDFLQPDPIILQTAFINKLTHKLLQTMPLLSDKKLNLLQRIFLNEKINCSILLDTLRSISDGHQWPLDDYDAENKTILIQEKDFIEIEKMFLERIKKEEKNPDFYNELWIKEILQFWKEMDPESYNRDVNKKGR